VTCSLFCEITAIDYHRVARGERSGIGAKPDDRFCNVTRLPRDGSERVYYWTFYRSGRRVKESKAAETWRPEAEFIREFTDVVGDLTSGSVDFVALSSELGVFPVSPAWADVQRSLERLENAEKFGQPNSEQEDDVSVVHDFSNLLILDGDIVALALFCGSAIGFFSPRPPQYHVLDGLKVISDAFAFGKVAVEEVRSSLRSLVQQLCDHFRLEVLPEVPVLSTQESVNEWQNWFENAAGRLDMSRIVGPQFIQNAQKTSWSNCFERFQDPSAQRPPRIDDLICAAAGVAPAKLLKFDIGSMTLGDWSHGFYRCAVTGRTPSDPDDLPSWFALAALDRLGFAVEGQLSIRLLELLLRRTLSPEELEPVKKWKPLNSPARRDFSVLVCTLGVPKTIPAAPSGWPLSQRCAGMVLGPKEINDLCARGTAVQDNIFLLLGVDQLAFELAAEAQEATVGASSDAEKSGRSGLLPEIEAIRKLFPGNTFPVIALIIPKRPTAEFPSPYFPIIAPQNLDELSQRIASSLKPDQDALRK
jgi:hypothetical protein